MHLRAGLYEAFMLTNIDASYPQIYSRLSVQRILQNAAGRYGADKVVDKQIALLQLLVRVAYNFNVADQARWRLAKAWSSQELYRKAIEVLKEIKSPEMKAEGFIADLEKKQAAQNK